MVVSLEEFTDLKDSYGLNAEDNCSALNAEIGGGFGGGREDGEILTVPGASHGVPDCAMGGSGICSSNFGYERRE